MNELPHWIENGICTNKGENICNLGYACDGCPYNLVTTHIHCEICGTMIPVSKKERENMVAVPKLCDEHQRKLNL